MLEVVSSLFIIITTHLFDCFIFSRIIKEKANLKIKNITLIIMISVLDYFIGNNTTDIIRIVSTNLITIFLFTMIYKKSVSKSLVGIIFIYIGYVISEIILSIILFGIFRMDSEFIVTNIFWKIITNTSILAINFLIFNIKKYMIFVQTVIKWFDNKKYFTLFVNCMLITAICGILIYPLSLNNSHINIMFFIILSLLGIIVFVISFIKEKSNNNQLTSKYDQLLEYVKDYEIEVVEKGKAIHEHKNQLAVIDGMIPKNNKKLKEYIDEKLENISKLDDNIWLEKLTNLPMGGIKGLVYLKIKKMLNNNISIFVDIDKNLKNKNKWESINNNLEDYTKIIGVYLDNAIEAAMNSKDKQIVIEFIDNKDNIEFILSNTYKGIINFEEIDNEKFSTKGKNRGYGLSLVKDIIDKNKSIKQKREINGKFYAQKLYIKK